jgi:transposase
LRKGAEQTQCQRTANTCANVLRLEPALWTFLREAGVPPTNNRERALRSLVLKRKISGPTRSRSADLFLARVFSICETCRRQGRDLWDYLQRAALAWIDNTAAPSLVPMPAAAAPAPSG